MPRGSTFVQHVLVGSLVTAAGAAGALAFAAYGCSSQDEGAAGGGDASSSGDTASEAAVVVESDAGEASTTSDAGHGIPAPGTVTTDATACDAGALPGATCRHVTVHCPGVSDLGVGLRAARPAAAARATILVGGGGAGNGWLEDDPLAASLEKELVANGYVVVSRKWDDPGWFAGSAGLLASSCRYGTLLRWVDENVRAPSAPYCALGLSGGSYELGYALAHWDAADRLKGALLLAGPAVTRLDLVCPSVAPTSWTATDCHALAAKYALPCTGTIFCTLQSAADVVDSAWTPDHPCTDAGDPRVAALADDGIVAPSSRLAYPSTAVRMVLGADECGATELPYYDRITSDRGIAFPAATPHDVFTTDAGTAAAATAIREACVTY